MTKRAATTDISSSHASQGQLNDNFEAINTALENTVSLDGSTPNTMSGDLDMGSNDLINVKDVSMTGSLVVDGVNFVPTSATTVPDWEGMWMTSTAYVPNDMVREDGSVYICLTGHTSGTFATDLSNSLWELFASKGSTGAGSGDMVAANNLSEVVDADTALANLGGGSVGINMFKDTSAADVRTEISAQEQNAVLDDLAGLTQAADKIVGFDSASTAATFDLLDEDDMASDSETSLSTQQAIKAYVDSTQPAVLAKVESTGTITTNAGSVGLASCTRTNEGDYTITYNSAMSSSDYVIQVTCQNVGNCFASVQAWSTTTANIDVRSRGSSDVDADFWVTIWDV